MVVSDERLAQLKKFARNGHCLASSIGSAEHVEIHQMVNELIGLRSKLEMAITALHPFHDVAENDIGDDEADSDLFRPINKALADTLRVGHLRKARDTFEHLTEDTL